MSESTNPITTPISYGDTKDTIYDPYHPKYGDPVSVQNETYRTFDLCNSCRMCFKYCPSFPSLFQAMDRVNANVSMLTEKDVAKVVGECYQCRVCYIVCPYTETDKHPYKLDFPGLMLRAKNLAVKKSSLSFRERLLGNPDMLGRLNTGLLSFLINWAMKNSLHRSLMQKVLGIHKKKLMPAFHKKSFTSWFRKRYKQRVKQVQVLPEKKVVLFSTCFVNYNNPQVGKDAVAVLEKNKIWVEHSRQNCCGMPALDGGNFKLAIKKMESNVRNLTPYVVKGYRVLVINPTCSLTLKQEYKRFLPPGELRECARQLSAATEDLHEYLFELKKEKALNLDFKSSPEKVAYHVPCHLRAQNIGFRSRDVMRTIPNTTVSPVAECCGHDGTWAMKKEYFDMSLQAGKRAFDGLQKLRSEEEGIEQVATDCPLAAIQLQQGLNTDNPPVHPIQILARAYRNPEQGGFPKGI